MIYLLLLFPLIHTALSREEAGAKQGNTKGEEQNQKTKTKKGGGRDRLAQRRNTAKGLGDEEARPAEKVGPTNKGGAHGSAGRHHQGAQCAHAGYRVDLWHRGQGLS
jgi:hypothetical protein